MRLDYDANNSLSTAYTTTATAGVLLETTSEGQSAYPLQDGNEDVTALTNSSGAVTARFRYGAFGQPFASNSTATRFTFAGYQFDVHSGLYYARQRYYDPSTGRFLGEDPMLAVNLTDTPPMIPLTS